MTNRKHPPITPRLLVTMFGVLLILTCTTYASSTVAQDDSNRASFCDPHESDIVSDLDTAFFAETTMRAAEPLMDWIKRAQDTLTPLCRTWLFKKLNVSQHIELIISKLKREAATLSAASEQAYAIADEYTAQAQSVPERTSDLGEFNELFRASKARHVAYRFEQDAARDAKRAMELRTAADSLEQTRAPMPVVQSWYDFFGDNAPENSGFSLYSYMIFPSYSEQNSLLVKELLESTGAAEGSAIDPAILNVIYLPTYESVGDFDPSAYADVSSAASEFTKKYYDYAMARKLLAAVCRKPYSGVRSICASDTSRGPYMLTYGVPIGSMSSIPPPYLVVHIGAFHERAFGEVLAAYKAQVKRNNYPDRERIESFYLSVLDFTLRTADVAEPIAKAFRKVLGIVLDRGDG